MSADVENSNNKPLFRDINADDDDPEVTEIESICMNCHEQGMTRLMLTKIPFFKEVVLCSFHCDHCQFSNSEIQSAGRVQELGVKYTLQVNNVEDLNRQVVKSETASFAIPTMDFEQPASGKGEINTIEGILDGVINGLKLMQPQRRNVEPETAEKIDTFISNLEEMKKVETPFTIVVDDPSGNSYVENPHAPKKDAQLKSEHYRRSAQQEKQLGLVAEDSEANYVQSNEEEEFDPKKEVMQFRSNCSNCNSPCETNMKVVDIPFFKEVVLMATVCDACGKKDSEVKGGAGIEPQGCRITLKITDSTDLSRDVLKSDTCGVKIPELDLELEDGTLGGKFTTLEGLLTNIREQLGEKNPFLSGDSSDSSIRQKLGIFLEKLDKMISGEMLNFHFILDDPAGNSYLQNLYAPDPDPEMTVEKYTRNFDQNECLGLNDMKTENYNEQDQSS